jgi:hypothetical protein
MLHMQCGHGLQRYCRYIESSMCGLCWWDLRTILRVVCVYQCPGRLVHRGGIWSQWRLQLFAGDLFDRRRHHVHFVCCGNFIRFVWRRGQFQVHRV